MHRDRIRAELPDTVSRALDVLAAYDAALGAATWDHVTRSVILRLARELLADDALGWNRPARSDFLAGNSSPALDVVVPSLPVRAWGARTVVDALCTHFELYGAADSLRVLI